MGDRDARGPSETPPRVRGAAPYMRPRLQGRSSAAGTRPGSGRRRRHSRCAQDADPQARDPEADGGEPEDRQAVVRPADAAGGEAADTGPEMELRRAFMREAADSASIAAICRQNPISRCPADAS